MLVVPYGDSSVAQALACCPRFDRAVTALRLDTSCRLAAYNRLCNQHVYAREACNAGACPSVRLGISIVAKMPAFLCAAAKYCNKASRFRTKIISGFASTAAENSHVGSERHIRWTTIGAQCKCPVCERKPASYSSLLQRGCPGHGRDGLPCCQSLRAPALWRAAAAPCRTQLGTCTRWMRTGDVPESASGAGRTVAGRARGRVRLHRSN